MLLLEVTHLILNAFDERDHAMHSSSPAPASTSQVILEWFSLDQLFAHLVLISLLGFVGGQMAPLDRTFEKASRFVFVVGFLLYSCMAIDAWGIAEVWGATVIVVRAILAGGTAYGLGLIGLSMIAANMESLKAMKALLLKKDVKQPEPVVMVEPISEPEPIPLPPPLTRDELAERAQASYQQRLLLIERANLDSLEERSAKERAKQTYLHEIDGLIS